MALIKCKECGEDVSKKAANCPKCGAPVPKSTSILTWIVVILIIGFVAGQILREPGISAPAKLVESSEAKTKRLLTELKTIPAAEFVKNKERYAELVKLHPDNAAYKKKLDYYAPLAKRREQIERQFSSWDGSHRELEKYIKKSMNDPDSYDHVETKFIDKGDHLLVFTTFRGKNGFGGIVKSTMSAEVSIDGRTMTIIQ